MPETASSTDEPADAAPKPLISPAALVLPLASGAAYGLAYCYELGYTETFRIPRGVVTISLADFLVAAFGAATFLVLLWFWVAVWAALGARSGRNWFKNSCASIATGLPALSLVLLIWLAGYHIAALVMLAGVGVGTVAGILYDPDDSDAAAEERGAFSNVFGAPLEGARCYLGRYAGPLLAAAVIAGATAFLLGRGHALHPDSYVAVEEIPGYVVLRTYREHVVMASYVPETGERGRLVRVYGWDDLAGMTLYRMPARVSEIADPVAAPTKPDSANELTTPAAAPLPLIESSPSTNPLISR